MQKALVAYYSFSGSTRALAGEIARQTGADSLELVPKKPYSFDYNTAAKEARSEINRGFCPELRVGIESISAYDAVFIGTPNWFRSIAPPVLSFLRQHDFSNKRVIPFCTHGGGGFGDIEKQLAEECPGAVLQKGLTAQTDVTAEQIAVWLSQIGFRDSRPK